MSTYTLPDLAYDYGALEPHISGEIMELHHSKHHKAYVDGANQALEKLASARESGDFATVPMLEKNLAFNLGGHTNHSVFWQNMSPDGGGRPETTDGRRPHDLRHTAASLWIAAGVDIKTIAVWLGHSSTKLTLDTYGHLMGTDAERAAIERINRAFGHQSGTSPGQTSGRPLPLQTGEDI